MATPPAVYQPFRTRERRSLTQLLIAKSIMETLLLGTIAVAFYFALFPPHFRGWGEVTSREIAGWAVNEVAPWERVQVQLFIDGNFVASGVANVSRPDVMAAGWAADEWHGYSFAPQSLTPGLHTAQVYALNSDRSGQRKTLQQLGNPILFVVDHRGLFGAPQRLSPRR